MRGEIRPLTGVRGLAALFVAIYHTQWQIVTSGHAWPLLKRGYLAVDLFFCLSGFVLSLTYKKNFSARVAAGAYLDFMIRRIGRIWPLYAVVTLLLALSFQFHMLAGRPAALGEALANATMTQTWWGVRSLDEPAWSVSAELLVYFLFPFLLLVLSPRKTLTSLISIFILIVFLFFLLFVESRSAGFRPNNGPMDASASSSIFPLSRCLIEFTMGVVTANLLDTRVGAFFSGNYVFLVVVSIEFIVLCISGTDLLFVAILPPLLLCLACGSKFPESFFGNKFVHKLGVWSYALYLIHYHSNKIHDQLFNHVKHFAPGLNFLSWVIQFLVLFVASGVLYALVEGPGRRIARTVCRRLESLLDLPKMTPEKAEGAV